jgi:hypothetical protein
MTARCSRWRLGAREGAGVGWVWWSGVVNRGMERVGLQVQTAFAGWDIRDFQIYERETLQCKSLGGWRLLQEPIKANLP